MDDHVEPTEIAAQVVESSRQRLAIADVGGQGHDFAAETFEPLDRLDGAAEAWRRTLRTEQLFPVLARRKSRTSQEGDTSPAAFPDRLGERSADAAQAAGDETAHTVTEAVGLVRCRWQHQRSLSRPPTVPAPVGDDDRVVRKQELSSERVDLAVGELVVRTAGQIDVTAPMSLVLEGNDAAGAEDGRVSSVEAQVATGSGDVRADDFDGDELQVATGSGDVEVAMIRGRSIQVATGSGEIEAREVDAESVELATGSGDVSLLLDHMGGGEFSIGTGSGDIALTMPVGASADLHAETDGGEIRVALGDAEFQQQDPDEVRLTVGKGGARVRLGSGNGDITIGN